ncbi:hypothetical protein F9L33_14725 [Amylibacter sp. SFDW26]|uniref:alginate O-acetyltransferase AlgX-related protein n=1 Tax=Amylibacter sp. SFDW26 TaxID=2652722 RepID=UPI0012626ACE|nr:hypothetical protein [Amylibacter sp. SFDW26]KAB7610146.1 hypothetical protein F9L33_14725 [Amylibacter sp. SFDW26]
MRQLILTAILSTAICAPIVQAAPYCDALMKIEALPKKYQKKGPFYSDMDQGWIIANDQLVNDFEFNAEASALMTKIAEAFQDRGVKLVLAVPPPRPLFMDVSIDGYDREKATASFQSYLKSISATGVFAADLLSPMKASLGQGAYFSRDTHWTPKGAAFAAFSLIQQIGKLDDLEKKFLGLKFLELYSEKGSLTAVVDKTCKTTLKPEGVMSASFTQKGNASDLLSDLSDDAQKVALAGTSFSNRYGRDVYRFSDALSFALNSEVDNYSVSGGGIISAIEALILSDAFQKGTYHTVIWEVPYTQNLSDTHSLRQILGALRLSDDDKPVEIFKGTANSGWQSVSLSVNISEVLILQIITDSANLKEVEVELYSQENEKTRIKLRKSNRVPLELQSDIWSASLEGLGVSVVKKMKLRLKGAKSSQNLSAHLIN